MIPNPPRFRCGHPRTPANTARSGNKRQCRQCRNARQAYYNATASMGRLRQPKGDGRRKPLKWISAPREVIESCRPAFLAAIEPKKPTGRPRKVAA